MSVNISLVSSRQVIARLLDGFKIDTADWIPRAALWIQDAMFDMRLVNNAPIVKIDLDVEEYKVKMPDGSRGLEAVSYNGVKLTKLEYINIVESNVGDMQFPTNTYELTKNGYLLFGFETGTVSIYCRSLPVEVEEEGKTKVLYPLIPDNPILFEALEFYILTKLLQKGYNHPLFSLSHQSEILNPYLRWLKLRKQAANSVTSLSFDERAVISTQIRTLLPSDRYPAEVLFKETYIPPVIE